MARQRNTLPLPTIRSSAGLRLPPDRHSLIACNYHLKSAAKKVCDTFKFEKKFLYRRIKRNPLKNKNKH